MISNTEARGTRAHKASTETNEVPASRALAGMGWLEPALACARLGSATQKKEEKSGELPKLLWRNRDAHKGKEKRGSKHNGRQQAVPSWLSHPKRMVQICCRTNCTALTETQLALSHSKQGWRGRRLRLTVSSKRVGPTHAPNTKPA